MTWMALNDQQGPPYENAPSLPIPSLSFHFSVDISRLPNSLPTSLTRGGGWLHTKNTRGRNLSHDFPQHESKGAPPPPQLSVDKM